MVNMRFASIFRDFLALSCERDGEIVKLQR